jgi:probable HAF family extracellular repeat protein
MRKHLLAGAIAALFFGTSAFDALSAEFVHLGDFPEGAFHSVAQAISADGTTIVGAGSRYESDASSSDALRWSESTGVLNLQTLPLIDSPRTFAHGVSGDGEVVVGGIDYHFLPGFAVNSEPFRWTAAEGVVSLGLLSDGAGFRHGAAGDVSADGSVIVGQSFSGDGPTEAFRWTIETGMIGLGELSGGDYFSTATGVSANGDVIVGIGHSELGSEAFRWTEETGLIGLSDLSGGYFGSFAEGVSANGRVVVGSSFSEMSDGTLEAFRWTDALGMQPLGDLAGGSFESGAFGVSPDGSIVLGFSDREDGEKAFVWDESHGMRDLQELLVAEFSLGPQLSDWRLTIANDISDDGLSIVGHGLNPDGNTEAWLVRLDRPLTAPEPSTSALTLIIAMSLFTARRRRSR